MQPMAPQQFVTPQVPVSGAQMNFGTPPPSVSPYPSAPPPGGGFFGGPAGQPNPQPGTPQPLQGGFFGGMNQRQPLAPPPSMGQYRTPGVGVQTPSMMPAPARAAQSMQRYGRGNDSMMMHVTPGEVQGLQALAQSHGGSLTINPQTGLPEAGFLENILPTLLGAGLALIPGVGPLAAAAMVGGGYGVAKGDLMAGLQAGLGAFGGAGLAGALGGMAGAAGSAAQAGVSSAGALGTTAAEVAATAANPALAAGATNAASALGSQAIPGAVANAAGAAGAAAPGLGALAHGAGSLGAAIPGGVTNAMGAGINAASGLGSQALPGAVANGVAPPPNFLSQLDPKLGDFAQRFQQEAGRGFSDAGASTPSAMRTGAAAMGVAMPLLQSMQPELTPYEKEEDWNYEGPYTPTQRTARFKGANNGDSSEFSYFDNTNPYPGFQPAPKGYAEGGEVDRAIKMPPVGYQAGMGPEHDYNFRQVALPASVGADQALAGAGRSGAPRSLFGVDIEQLLNKKDRDAADKAKIGRSYVYDPRSQSLIDGAPGGATGAGGGGGGGSRHMAGLQALASGGGVHLKDGGFVVDARTVSELGNGSSGAGQELLARHGGRPIRGGGDGASDSIRANIGGRQEARVARDEVKFDPKAVRRMGGGNQARGAQKLYALMEQAQKARKTAGRGQDTKLRKALPK